MDEEQKFWLWFTTIVCTTIISITILVTVSLHFKHCKMIDNGWCRGTIPGEAMATWYKNDNK